MIDWVGQMLVHSSAGVLFLILMTGLLLGQIRVLGLNLGSSGVLFTAIVAGHYRLIVPEIYGSLGVIFFVYAVGLQAGPRFVHTIRTNGPALLRMGTMIIGAGAGAALVAGKLFGVEPGIIVGSFAGAMTSTPALAAGLEVFRSSDAKQLALMTVSYGMAYPVGVVGTVLAVQLFPKFLRNPRLQSGQGGALGDEGRLETQAFLVENSNIVGKTVEEADLWKFATVNLSRILQKGAVNVVLASTVLHRGDEVLAVGRPEDLDKLELLIGPRVDSVQLFLESPQALTTRDISVGGKANEDLSTATLCREYGVSITRVLRLNISLSPGRNRVLEPGDRIRVVGNPQQLDKLEKTLGHREASIFETDMLGLSSGILAGIVLGLIPWKLTGSMGALKLGLAGGPLFMSIIAGHFGKIGPISNRIPASARFLLREFGLVLFLAYAGSKAGEHFVETFVQSGGAVVAMAIVTMLVPIFIGFVVAYWVYRYDLSFSLGLICGGMTSTPALGTLISSLKSQEPAVGYAAIYPIALIAVTISAQMMALFL